jgi:para-nitrobenzyl esterase
MVWIHGGAFLSGSGGLPLYDGGHLAEMGDVVVVTINHRLNVFGYLWLGDLVPSLAGDASPGQQDLVAALRWIRTNIAAFGGDPGNVTLFGESGGGAKIGSLLATPRARGLFHKAIVESGSQTFVHTREEATAVARFVMTGLGIDKPDAAILSAIPRKALFDVMKACQATLGSHAFQPLVDGAFMPHQTWQDGAPPESAGIPMIIGTNQNEATAFLADMRCPVSDDTELHARASKAFGMPKLSDDQFATFLADYREVMPEASRLDVLVAMATDVWMWHSAIQQASDKVLQASGRVFMYEFAWKTPCFGGAWSLHGVEIPFVSGNLVYGTAWDGSDTDLIRSAADPQNDSRRLADDTMRAWSSFAHHGDPSTPRLPWPAYDNRHRATMILDRNSRVENDPRAARRKLVKALPLGW